MARAGLSTDAATEPAAMDGQQWRLRYVVGALVDYTEWTSDVATVGTWAQSGQPAQRAATDKYSASVQAGIGRWT